MAKGYNLEQTGPQVQEAINKSLNLTTATQSKEGLMSAQDKQKLDSLDSELAGKVDKVPGKGLSTNDYDNTEKGKVASAYQKPVGGIPASDLAEGVIPDTSQFITKTVNDLANYYLKTETYSRSETYTKTEVDALIALIKQFSYQVVSELPEASESTMYKLYLVPSADPQTQNVKDEYITVRSGSEGAYTYAWEQIGSTAINLSGYVTTEALNAALANYTTTANLTTLLAAKQDVIADLSTIRTGAAAGATAYQKPSGGVPESDLASSVQTSLSKADTAIQPAEFNELEEEVGTIGNGAYEEAWDGSSAPVVADIPAGVSVTYNSTSYTGTLAASASTVDKIYLVSDGNGNYDRYVTVESSGTYSWKKVGTTAIPLSDYATKAEVSQLEAEGGEITDFPLLSYAIYPTGKFGSSTDYSHAALPVEPGQVYYLVGNTSTCRAAFATSNEATSGGDIPLVSGTSVMEMPNVGEYYKFIIPEGCSYLLFNAGDVYGTRCFRYIGDRLDDIDDEIEEIAYEISDVVDIASLEQAPGAYIAIEDKWTARNPTTRTGSFIPVNSGDKVKIVAGEINNCKFSFLTGGANFVVASGTPPFVQGTGGTIVTKGETQIITVPDGCKYLHINRFYDAYNCSPASVVIFAKKLEKIEDSLQTISPMVSLHDEQLGNERVVGIPAANILNGTLQNESNATRVRFDKAVPVTPGSVITCIINKELFDEGNKWLYAYRQYDAEGNILSQTSIIASATNNIVKIVDNAVAIKFSIGQNNSGGAAVTLRQTDFVDGDISIKYQYPKGLIPTVEELSVNRASAGLSFVGMGTVLAGSGNLYNIAPKQAYRCRILNPNAPLDDTSGGNWRFIINAYDKTDTRIEQLVLYSTADALPDYVDFVTPEGTEYVKIFGRCSSGILFPVIIFPISNSEAQVGNILVLNPESEFKPKFLSAKKRYYTSTDGSRPSPLVVMHISDIHGNWDNVARFIEFSQEYESYIDELVNTGDTVSGQYTDGVDGYVALDGVENIINVIGNHDTREGNDWQSHIGVDAYNLLIKPFVSGWGVTQPTGAEANGYCYFYKDYAEKNIRMVFVDIMSYDATQDTWLASVLSDARTNGYHIVIFTHFSGARNQSELNEKVFEKVPCNYTTLYSLGSDSTQLSGYNTNAYMMNDTVNDFIVAGGHFVGFVQGHYHADFVSKVGKYPNQLIFSIGATKAGEMRDFNHIIGTRDQDEFQIVAIDTVNTIVKLYKVGANYDRYGRKKGSVCVDYTTGQVLGEGW